MGKQGKCTNAVMKPQSQIREEEMYVTGPDDYCLTDLT